MHIKEKIRVLKDNLFSQSRRTVFKIENAEFVQSGYKKGHTPPTEGYTPCAPYQRYVGLDNHYWIKAKFTTPNTDDGHYFVLSAVTGLEGQNSTMTPQGLIYLNGKISMAHDTNHTEIYLEPNTEYEMYDYFYVGLQDEAIELKFSVLEYNKEIEHLYNDIRVAYEVCELLKPDSTDYISIMRVLLETANIIDMREIYSDSYFESIRHAQKHITEELYEKLCSVEGKPIVNCVGHTHIDVEWKWTREQTREKIQRSFATAKALMDRYPEYKMMLSQPELYRYLKEDAPEKYEELKELVKQGRWEPEGAMYLEADCNLISGESFVRQIIQGKKFFRDEFGKENEVLFLPDVFGYSAALPQILKKSGVNYFVTSKISWNDTNTMPYDTFMWEGIDGTEIFTSFITNQFYQHGKFNTKTNYAGWFTPSNILGTWDRYLQKDYANHALTTFGYGDGGGGPSKEMLETHERLKLGMPGMPVSKITTLKEYLEDTKRDFDENSKIYKRTPRWVGELYLEFHRGTYTSIAEIKRNNRKSEFLMQKAEALSFTDYLMGGKYDKEGLYKKWNLILHDQFHDIIPGSSIKEVYDLTEKDYKEVFDYGNELIDNKLSAIAERIDTKGGVLVYNSLGFPRKCLININGETRETADVIPAFGWAVIDDYALAPAVSVSGLTAENKYYKLTLDEKGNIASLLDKGANREVFKKGEVGNEIQVFEDYPYQYDNWELSDYYKQKMWTVDNAEITPIFDGNRAGFKVVKKYLDSVICQNIWLYTENPRIDFENDIDWKQSHQVMKAAFPFDVHSNNATYEIQFGHVSRPSYANTSWEEAKFEVCGHKWADISEEGYGVSLLNDSKYGFNTEGSTLKITMLKSGTFPHPTADRCRHVFTYSLLPHAGSFKEANVIQEAYSLNQPLDAVKVAENKGSLADRFSLIQCNERNVVVETVKMAEDDDSMVVRLYEAFDSRGEVTLSLGADFKKAFVCGLCENELEEIEIKDNTVTFPIKNFEIVTLKFKR